MDIETIVKIIGAIVAIPTIGKIIHDITTTNRSRLREEYKFTKEFLEEIESNPDLHPLVVESGYHAIAGSKFLSSEEVAYLLSLKKPGMCLSDYRLSRKYLQIINKNGDFSVEFRDKYASLQSRKVRKIVYLFLYFFLVFIGISPLFLPSKYTPLIFITLLVFGYYAFMSIISYI